MRPLALAALVLAGCGKVPEVNLMTLEDDRNLGAELHQHILSEPGTYPLLDPAEYPEAYDHLYYMTETLLNTSEIRYKDEFDWQFYLIDDDETLNAFAAPGGYLYFYTGLIKYLDEEDHFVGVVGHEIAHADRRHSTKQLTRAHGVSTILGLLLGEDPGLLAEIASGLAGLDYSRQHESESDSYSVAYLCETEWAADGAAGFFEKISQEGGISMPDFLSTHPSSDTRVEDIRAEAIDRGCSTELNPNAQYQAFIDSLP